jgi:antitoxin component of RelBE/YafQ-DinJ toxin-antitoxin module
VRWKKIVLKKDMLDMKLNFNRRLKDYLINIIIREGDKDAWEHLKTLNPDNDDLYTIIIRTKFLDEAWELTKQQSPSKEDLIPLVKHSEKNKEAAALLLQLQPLENEELEEMIEHAQSDEAAKILMNQNPDNDQLIKIMKFTNLKNEAAKLLLNQPIENSDLIEIIDYSDLKKGAWEKLLQQNPTNEELSLVVNFTDLEELAWQQLLKQNPTNEELMAFVNDYSETGRKRTEAGKLILKQDPDIETLTHMIDKGQLADEAFELLEKKSPTSDDLGWLIWRSNIKVNEAADLSLKSNPTKKQLLEIFEYSDRKEEAAKMLEEMPLEISELVDIILSSNNKKAVELLSEKTQFYRSPTDEQELFQRIKNEVTSKSGVVKRK